MDYILPPSPQASLPLAGSAQRFPIRRIFCIGKNYSDHVKEMGGDPAREEPLFFTKPADAVVEPGQPVPYPPGTDDMHFEVEMVAALGSQVGAGATLDTVLDAVLAYGTGIDLTRRDLQAEAKKRGRPWDMSKAFDASALCSELHLAENIGHPDSGEIALQLDGTFCQQDNIANMVWSLPEILVALSGLVQLQPGDLIYTGTPAGVGAVNRGQTMDVWVEGVARASWTIS